VIIKDTNYLELRAQLKAAYAACEGAAAREVHYKAKQENATSNSELPTAHKQCPPSHAIQCPVPADGEDGRQVGSLATISSS
jgi:hypothetical protein